MPTHHRIIRASAGSGKTFQLTTRYIDLLHQGQSPDTILATTFTRKAAGEILAKVFDRLAEAIENDAKRQELSGHLTGNANLTQTDCQALLVKLARSLHRLSITTIDGFFNRIAQAFRYELDVPLDPTIVEASSPIARRLRAQAIEAMLADEDLPTLIRWLRLYHHDTAARSVTDAIDRLVGDFHDVYRQAPRRDQWDRLPRKTPLNNTDLAAAIAHLEALEHELPKTQKGTPDQRWGKAWANDLNQAKLDQWEAFVDGGLAGKIVAGEDTFQKHPITPNWLNAYEPLIRHARAYLVDAVMLRHLAIFDLLERFDKHYESFRRSQGVLLYSDITHKLARMAAALPGLDDDHLDDSAMLDIYFRLDARVSHLLLDEFQDTSLDQWAVLRPFAEEITAHAAPDLATGRTFFCVGDTKQAIYGWRGGCGELFDEITTQLHLGDDARRDLTKSYRSSPIILDTVNQVFAGIASCPILMKQDADQQAAQRFANQYKPHTSAKTDLPGYVCLETSPPDPNKPSSSDRAQSVDEDDDDDEEKEAREAVITGHETFAADRVQEWHQQMPGATIAVLVATNAMATQMIYELRHLGLDVSGEGGGPLTDSSAVATFLSAMVMADHPGDSASAFHVVNSPLGEVLGLTTTTPQAVQATARQIRTRLLTEGYAQVISDWTAQVADSCDANNFARLKQLIDLAEEFDGQSSLRPARFVEYVEQTTVEHPQPAKIRVMTIHKAKGLEFDIVVLCQLDRRLSDKAKFLIGREHDTDPIDAVYPVATQKIRPLSPTLTDQFDHARSRRRYEDLCSLYVALTRPKQALHLIVKPIELTAKGYLPTPSLSYATILRQALAPDNEQIAAQQTLYEIVARANLKAEHASACVPKAEHASACVSSDNNLPNAISRDATPPVGRREYAPASLEQNNLAAPILGFPCSSAPGAPRRNWLATTPSQLEGQGKVTANQLLNLAGDTARVRGTLIHAWFQMIGFLDDPTAPSPTPTDDALRQRAQLLWPEKNIAFFDELIHDFRTALRQPAVIQALSSNGAQTLWRERPFAVRDGGALLRGQFDRVAITRHDNHITNVTLVDFKTDHLPATTDPDHQAQLAAHTERYRPQISAYQRALSHLLPIEPHQVSAILLFISSRCLVRL